jgi:hypothetical protein
MSVSGASTGSPMRSRRAKWLRGLAAAVALYFLCWAATWVFAPAALNRWWATHHAPMGYDMAGNATPVEFRTGVPFKGEGFEYLPDFAPAAKWWCCVGEPWCPAPFVVASEVAWVDGSLSGFAGEVWFIWTPFGLVKIQVRRVWVA